jgi:hypothetical protein
MKTGRKRAKKIRSNVGYLVRCEKYDAMSQRSPASRGHNKSAAAIQAATDRPSVFTTRKIAVNSA